MEKYNNTNLNETYEASKMHESPELSEVPDVSEQPVQTEPETTPEPPQKKFNLSKRLISEIAGGVLLLIFMASAFGRVSQGKYSELQDEYQVLSTINKNNLAKLETSELDLKKLRESDNKLKDEYDAYKKRMQPYEDLEIADIETKRLEAEKAAEEKKQAEEKAAAEQKAAEEKAAKEAADKKAAEEAARLAEAQRPTEHKNALRTAKEYLNAMAFSRSGLGEQLAYEGYPQDAIDYALAELDKTVDYNKQAAKMAKEYLNAMGFSQSGLVEQLLYEGFSQEQAEYGASEAFK